MDKKEILLTVAVLGVLGFLVYKAEKKEPKASSTSSNSATNVPPTTTATATTAGQRCPDGEVPCASSGKCYDPKIQYLVSPCATDGTAVASFTGGKKNYVSGDFLSSQKEKLNY